MNIFTFLLIFKLNRKQIKFNIFIFSILIIECSTGLFYIYIYIAYKTFIKSFFNTSTFRNNKTKPVVVYSL